jgi:hypothetical protein
MNLRIITLKRPIFRKSYEGMFRERNIEIWMKFSKGIGVIRIKRLNDWNDEI